MNKHYTTTANRCRRRHSRFCRSAASSPPAGSRSSFRYRPTASPAICPSSGNRSGPTAAGSAATARAGSAGRTTWTAWCRLRTCSTTRSCSPRSSKWLDWTLDSQDELGHFGPKVARRLVAVRRHPQDSDAVSGSHRRRARDPADGEVLHLHEARAAAHITCKSGRSCGGPTPRSRSSGSTTATATPSFWSSPAS